MKTAAFTAATLVAGLVVMLLTFAILSLAGGAMAQDAVVVADPSPWPAFLAALWPVASTFLVAVLGLLASIVSYYARQLGGSHAEAAANKAYELLLAQAAGWLLGERAEGKAPTLDEAVDYLRRSYPEVDRHEPSDAKLANDITGMLGRLAPAIPVAGELIAPAQA